MLFCAEAPAAQTAACAGDALNKEIGNAVIKLINKVFIRESEVSFLRINLDLFMINLRFPAMLSF